MISAWLYIIGASVCIWSFVWFNTPLGLLLSAVGVAFTGAAYICETFWET